MFAAAADTLSLSYYALITIIFAAFIFRRFFATYAYAV